MFSKFRSNYVTQRMNSYAQTLMHVHSWVCDHTDDHKAVIAPWRQTISISIDQQSCCHVALTWESISHLGCLGSLGFHDHRWDKDRMKIQDALITAISSYNVVQTLSTAETLKAAATYSSYSKGLVYGAILHRKLVITLRKESGVFL